MGPSIQDFKVYYPKSIDEIRDVIEKKYKHDDQKKTSQTIRVINSPREAVAISLSCESDHYQSTSLGDRSVVRVESSDDNLGNSNLSISNVLETLLPFATGSKSLRDILSDSQIFFSKKKSVFPGMKLNKLLDSVRTISNEEILADTMRNSCRKIEVQKEFDKILGDISVDYDDPEFVVESTCSILS